MQNRFSSSDLTDFCTLQPLKHFTWQQGEKNAKQWLRFKGTKKIFLETFFFKFWLLLREYRKNHCQTWRWNVVQQGCSQFPFLGNLNVEVVFILKSIFLLWVVFIWYIMFILSNSTPTLLQLVEVGVDFVLPQKKKKKKEGRKEEEE